MPGDSPAGDSTLAGEFRLRRWRPTDRAAVIDLHNRALAAVDAHAGDDHYVDLLDVPGVFLDGGGEFLVGELGGRLVAMGAVRRLDATRGWLTRMRIDPSCWRRGLGRRLLLALEARARELGLTRLELDTAFGQVAAQRLYEAHGYRRTGIGRVDRFEVYYYAKDLDGEPA